MLALVPKMFDFFGLADLPDRDKRTLLRAFYFDLELRVGYELAGGLSTKDLQDFEEIMEYLRSRDVKPEDDPSLAWLEHVRPDYREVVHRQLQVLLQALFDRSPEIAGIAEIEQGRVGSDPVAEVYDFMMRAGAETRSRKELL